MPLQAFRHPGGQARRHGLSSEGQKRKYDHLRCNSCLPLQGLGLTVFSLHWAYNWTCDARTCSVVDYLLQPWSPFFLFSFDNQKVWFGAEPFKVLLSLTNHRLRLTGLCLVSQVWKEVQSWDSGHAGLRAAVEGKHRHASTVEVCVWDCNCKSSTSLYLSQEDLTSDLCFSLTRYDPSLWWCCPQYWPHCCPAAADILTSAHLSLHTFLHQNDHPASAPFTHTSRHV